MKNYINTFILLEDVISSIIPEEIKYSKSLFIRDLFESENIDWEIYLGRLLDKTNNAESAVIDLLDKLEFQYLEKHIENGLDYDDNYKSFNNHRGRIVLFRAEHFNQEYQSFSRSMRCLEMLKSLKVDISVCLEYYLNESNIPPFKEVGIKSNKIPFFGSEAEFIALFVLLHKVGFLGINDKDLKLQDHFNFDQISKKELSKLILSKTKAAHLFSEYFYGISFGKDKKDFIDFLNPRNIESKFTDEGVKRLGEISRDIFIKKFIKAIEYLEAIKNEKNQKDFY